MCSQEKEKEKKKKNWGFLWLDQNPNIYVGGGGSGDDKKTALSKELPFDDAITFFGGGGWGIKFRTDLRKTKSHSNTQNQSRQDSQVLSLFQGV